MAKAAQLLEQSGRRVIRLCQATPWFGPPEWALEAVKKRLHEPVMHRYSPDPGLDEVKKLLCSRWFASRGLTIDPDTEIHLTCGASQAFVGALTVSADPGERVILSDPYYFDHLFAVHFLGLEPVFVPMIEHEGGYSQDIRRLADSIEEGASALVIVDPANPTGSVIGEEDLRFLAEHCAECGCMLIIDETYERLEFTDKKRSHPWLVPELKEVVLTVGSFSKSLGMAGWRLGYLFGPKELMDEAYKVHDSVAICSPVPAQALLREILMGPVDDWLDGRMIELRRRMETTASALDAGNGFFSWRDVEGGMFTFVSYSEDRNSLDVAMSVLEKAGIILVPGSAFGPAGERHLRLSFGSSSFDDLKAALEMLAVFEPQKLA